MLFPSDLVGRQYLAMIIHFIRFRQLIINIIFKIIWCQDTEFTMAFSERSLSFQTLKEPQKWNWKNNYFQYNHIPGLQG